MTLRRFALPTTPTARTGAGLALLALLGVGIASTNTDAVVAGRFTAALEAAPRHAPVEVASGSDKPLISGSEAYWLEKRRHESGGAAIEPAAWSAAPFIGSVAVGSRITIANGKDEHVLEVVAISDVAPAPGASAPPNGRAERKIAITCRDLSTPDGQLMTFETSVGTAPGAAKAARAL
jgi:hypothetical protein